MSDKSRQLAADLRINASLASGRPGSVRYRRTETVREILEVADVRRRPRPQEPASLSARFECGPAWRCGSGLQRPPPRRTVNGTRFASTPQQPRPDTASAASLPQRRLRESEQGLAAVRAAGSDASPESLGNFCLG